MQTRDQKYALDAYDNVSKIKETQEQKTARKYGVICHKLPILIHTAGLAQALAFVESRKDDQTSMGTPSRLVGDRWKNAEGRTYRASSTT